MIIEECVLELKLGDHIDRNIDELWDQSLPWETHIKSLDYSHITRVIFNSKTGGTAIYFSDPEYKTWFIVMYS